MEVSRRWFLGGLCASIPLVGLAPKRWRVREAEYLISFSGQEPIVVTAFTDGRLEASYRGESLPHPCDVGHGGWHVFEGLVGDSAVSVVVRRPEPGVLDVDSVSLYTRQDGRVVKNSPWSPRGFIPQPVLSMSSPTHHRFGV